MNHIRAKTLEDLEFTTILQQTAQEANAKMVKEQLLAIKPIANIAELKEALKATSEYHSSFESENDIPLFKVGSVASAVKLLKIADSTLSIKQLVRILKNDQALHRLFKFLKKLKMQFPTLFRRIEKVPQNALISNHIKEIISIEGDLKRDASPTLEILNDALQDQRRSLDKAFVKNVRRYLKANYLDAIKESVINDQRVLAVTATHKKKVAGNIMGTSKSGNIIFITPQNTIALQQKLQLLETEKRIEILRILKELTHKIAPFVQEIQATETYLINMEVVAAKARYAQRINGRLPKITTAKKLHFKAAYHPILKLQNDQEGKATIPQDLEMNEQRRIILISGPNAGGKSITLKTVGLLQLMLQSGFLIPVKEGSSTCIFDHILTDIGDNQSIENQLSTYSYRLKNMRYFLQRCNENSLLLIDEFGTGSDPELGGALAAVFLEEFHAKQSYGIITTHYANLKVFANENEGIINANMQFDIHSLEPLYQLQIGQAGSSFTFEVAQKNGIPFRLINRGKKKIDREKIRFDKSISSLQQEKRKLKQQQHQITNEQEQLAATKEALQQKLASTEQKLAQFQTLYQHQQKMLNIGRKVAQMLNRFFQNNDKKSLLGAFGKWAVIEKAKHQHKKQPSEATPQKPPKTRGKNKPYIVDKKLKNTEATVLKAIAVKDKKDQQIAGKRAAALANYTFKVGDRVSILNSKTVAHLVAINKKQVTMDCGGMTIKTTIDKIILITQDESKN